MSGAKTLLLLAAVPLLMGAEVYRWVDANGVVNYSQMKPRGVAAEQIATDPGAPPATPEAAPAPASSELSTEQRRNSRGQLRPRATHARATHRAQPGKFDRGRRHGANAIGTRAPSAYQGSAGRRRRALRKLIGR